MGKKRKISSSSNERLAKKFKDIGRKTRHVNENGSNVILFKIKGGKRIAHTATSRYQITMASLQPDDRKMANCICNRIKDYSVQTKKDDNRVILVIEHNLEEHILCILENDVLNQCKLNLMILPGEQIAYRTIGKIPILLTGATETS